MKNIENFYGINEIFVQKVIPRFDHNSFYLINCTTFNTNFTKNKMNTGTNDNYISIELTPNDHFNDFAIVFHDENENSFGPAKDGNILYVNFQRKRQR